MEDETKNRKKMIKRLSKSMSSPSRAEKFPPPLMRFLRSNVGSKSRRGRSRSSPMFMRRKNTGQATTIETTQQEPSSPKVTCIGQVRVRRSSTNSSKSLTKACSWPRRNNSSSSSASLVRQTPCWWVPRALCCHRHCFPGIHTKPRSCCCQLFRMWGLSFRFGYCKKVDDHHTRNGDDDDDDDDTASSSRVESIPRGHQNHLIVDSSATRDDIEVQNDSKQDVIDSITPPKNALLLTRCRSAPCRSPSLASRFWGSPSSKGDDEDRQAMKSEANEELHGVEKQQARPVSSMSRDHEVAEPRLTSPIEDINGASVNETSKVADKNIQDSRPATYGGGGGGGGAAVHPLVLSRCKSEPARTGARLNPDASQDIDI